MKSFRDLPEVLALSSGPSEWDPVFDHASALRVIDACTESEIAVLGVEVVRRGNEPDGWYVIGYSGYDVQYFDPRTESEWPKYVRANNERAAAFLVERAAVPDELHQFTTITWMEYEETRAGRLAFEKASSPRDEPAGLWWKMAGHALVGVGLLLSLFLVAGVDFISPTWHQWLLWPRALILGFLIVVPGGLVLREMWRHRRDDKGSVAFVLFMMAIFAYALWAIVTGQTPIHR